MRTVGKELNPNHPGKDWYPAFLNAYRKRAYQGAPNVALKINTPGIFYIPLLIAAANGQLGERYAAGKALRDLLTLRPDYAVIAREDLGKWFDPELVGAAAGPQFFLQTVEDLLWLLLTRPGEDVEHLFVCWLNETVIRLPRRLHRNPRARPWLGDFSIKIRRGLVSHLAALVGGKIVRQQLIPCLFSRYALDQVLTILPPADAKEFKRRVASWPQMLKNLVSEPQSTH